MPRLLAMVLLAAHLACTRTASQVAGKTTSAEVHTTEGTIESFGEDRRFVKIHHQTIVGYMQEMTMPFEGDPAVLQTLAVGDRVVFTFEEREDGRRVLVEIRKR